MQAPWSVAAVGDGVNQSFGQTARHQLDGLVPLGDALGALLDRPVGDLWTMRNGYALCTRGGLNAIAELLSTLHPRQIDALRGKLCIGLHRDVEVTEAETGGASRPIVSLAFCSALPVAYTDVPPK